MTGKHCSRVRLHTCQSLDAETGYERTVCDWIVAENSEMSV